MEKKRTLFVCCTSYSVFDPLVTIFKIWGCNPKQQTRDGRRVGPQIQIFRVEAEQRGQERRLVCCSSVETLLPRPLSLSTPAQSVPPKSPSREHINSQKLLFFIKKMDSSLSQPTNPQSRSNCPAIFRYLNDTMYDFLLGQLECTQNTNIQYTFWNFKQQIWLFLAAL